MRLLKTPTQYVVVCCAYLAHAIYANFSFLHRVEQIPTHEGDRGVVLPLLIGVSLVILLIPTALRHTTLQIEKVVVIITGVLLVMCVIGYLHDLGLRWAILPNGDLLFVIASWLAAMFSGLLTLEVVRADHACLK